MQPFSRGKLTFSNGAPVIDCNIASEKRDQSLIFNGLQTVQSTMEKISKRFSVYEILPGLVFNYSMTFPAFQNFFSILSTTYFHPCGTCSMNHKDWEGNEIEGVVNENLQVKDIENLRIVDASIIPHIPNYAIAKTVMIIAMFAAKVISSNKKC